MKISIICSSRRPYLWMELYNQIHLDNVDYEIIFIGPFKPRFKMPKNSRFIHTIVKPSQCFEIACRSSKGEFILGPLADDVKTDQSNILGILINFIKKQNNDLFLLSQQLESYGDEIIVPNNEYNDLVIPFAAIFSKRIFNLVNGVDANFIAVMYDADLFMRMMQIGCKVYFSGIKFIEKKRSLLEPTLYGDFSNLDKKYFEEVWKPDNIFNFQTIREIKKFNSNNIISISQEPKGKWKYKSSFLFYLMQSNFKNKILKILRLDFPFFREIYYNNKNNFFVKKFLKLIKFLFY